MAQADGNPFKALMAAVKAQSQTTGPFGHGVTPPKAPTLSNNQQMNLSASLLKTKPLNTWEKMQVTGPRGMPGPASRTSYGYVPGPNSWSNNVDQRTMLMLKDYATGNPPWLGGGTPPPPTAGGSGGGSGYGGGGGGGGTAVAPVTWSAFDAGVQGAPSWWKAMKPSEVTPGTEYLASLNMMIPFLSPEDQKVVANTIYQQDATNFGHLAPDAIGNVGYNPIMNQFGEQGIGQADQSKFTSAARAQSALDALTKLAGATGKTAADLGPGFRYLQSLLGSSKQFGGAVGQPQSRLQAQQQMAAMDPLLAQTQTGDMSVYGPLARMLANPFFSAGQLTPVQRSQDGTYVFGTPNKNFM